MGKAKGPKDGTRLAEGERQGMKKAWRREMGTEGLGRQVEGRCKAGEKKERMSVSSGREGKSAAFFPAQAFWAGATACGLWMERSCCDPERA